MPLSQVTTIAGIADQSYIDTYNRYKLFSGSAVAASTPDIKNAVYTQYYTFYSGFAHEADYTKPITLTLNNPYICILTVADVNTLYTACDNLYQLATNFRSDVANNDNRTSITYSSTSRTAYGATSASGTVANQFTNGSADGVASASSKAEQLINGYKQVVFMTDCLIYDLWVLMKSDISNMPTKSISNYTISALGSSLLSKIIATNIIQLNNSDYNLGFNNDTLAKNILAMTDYTNYKKYVFFARNLLNALQKDPKFHGNNNTNNYLPASTDKHISDTLAKGVDALTAAIAALETSYDSRWNTGSKYTDNTKGVYAVRDAVNANLQELYQFPGTGVDTASRQYTATMVAGTVWTVLASVLVYYVFTEL